MGYRANTITTHREYGSQSFSNWDAFDRFVARTEDTLGIEFIDEQNMYQVEKENVKKYLENLPENGQSDYGPFTNKELKRALEKSLEESPGDYVSWEWF